MTKNCRWGGLMQDRLSPVSVLHNAPGGALTGRHHRMRGAAYTPPLLQDSFSATTKSRDEEKSLGHN